MALIAPFNFPLEIPILQLMGALYMGNKVRGVAFQLNPGGRKPAEAETSGVAVN